MNDARKVHGTLNLIWQLFKPYMTMLPLTQRQWEELIEKSRNMEDWYKGNDDPEQTKLVQEMLLAFTEYLSAKDRKAKEG